MENKIRTRNCRAARLKTSYISDVELGLVSYIRVLRLILVPHIILILLIA